jgi:hypothetical protein
VDTRSEAGINVDRPGCRQVRRRRQAAALVVSADRPCRLSALAGVGRTVVAPATRSWCRSREGGSCFRSSRGRSLCAESAGAAGRGSRHPPISRSFHSHCQDT